MTTSSEKISNQLLEEQVVYFFSGKKFLNSLSNFWACRIVVNNEDSSERVYESGEHCFHGEKYYRIGSACLNETRKNELLRHSSLFLEGSGKTAAQIKRLGGKKGLLLNEDELALWTDISPEIQRIICDYKFSNYEEVRNDIEKSEYKTLVHPALRCSTEKVKTRFWEGRAIITEPGVVEIIGGNWLGKIWMNIRYLNLEC